jgi:energy-coupling factor transporter ATP-binding protein EcfA2
LLDKRATDLSGGEAQRVAVLRALLTNAKAILCDEPTSSLDDYNANQVLLSLKSWSDANQRPVVWVTHNLAQAAAFAEHFLFLRLGSVHQPSPELTERLAADDAEGRLLALQQITRASSGPSDGNRNGRGIISLARTPSCSQPQGKKKHQRTLAIRTPLPSKIGFLWASSIALSTDSPNGRAREKRNSAVFSTQPLAQIGGALENAIHSRPNGPSAGREASPALPVRPSPPNKALQMLFFLRAYSRWGLDLVAVAVLLQVFLATLVYFGAGRYYDEQLQDPSVARIMFEHVVDGRAVQPLYPPKVSMLQQELRDALAKSDPPAPSDKVSVFGRRHEITRLRLVGATGNCGNWTPVDTAIIDPADPLLNQLAVSRALTTAANSGSPPRNSALPLSQGKGESGIVVSDRVAKIFAERCNIDFSKPVLVEWSFDASMQNEAIAVSIAATASRMPPLYPYNPDVIVFEPTLRAHFDKSLSREPDSFRYANAYFPIENFDMAETLIQSKNYTIRTDSRAAVQSIKEMAEIVSVVPWIIVCVNIVIGWVIVKIVIDNILEINKRVFTLFNAYGYKMRDIAFILGTHLAPALIVAFAVLLALAAILYSAPAISTEPLQHLHQHVVAALVITLGVVTLITAAVLIQTVHSWWQRSSAHLANLLKE